MQVDIPEQLCLNNQQQWHTVNQIIQVPIFHTRVRNLISELEQVVWSCDSEYIKKILTNDNQEIIEINLFSPPYINKTKSWKLDPLERVSNLLIKEEQFDILVGIEYVLSNGLKLFDQFDPRHDMNNPCICRQVIFMFQSSELDKLSSAAY